MPVLTFCGFYGYGKINKSKHYYKKTLIIDGTYDLMGGTLSLDNCTIEIRNGGKICNGEITGKDSRIIPKSRSLGVRLSGTWKMCEIRDDWFDGTYLSDDDIIENINVMQSDDISQKIYLTKEQYNVRINKKSLSSLILSSNTSLDIKSTINVVKNDMPSYKVISIFQKQNIRIHGGRIVGDVLQHNGQEGAYGMGININNSDYIEVDGVYISNCWGDGIYIGGGKETQIGEYKKASRSIKIVNVIVENNRRQGLSITHAEDVTIANCKFINTGKLLSAKPSAGVDIEPNIRNGKNQSCKDISFKDCFFSGNLGGSFSS